MSDTQDRPCCAAPGCEHPVERTNRPGRPPIYCSPACRPSRRRTTTSGSGPIAVELAHPELSVDGRPPERVWSVTLRRGTRRVTIAEGLGWPSARALTRQLEELLTARRQEGGARR